MRRSITQDDYKYDQHISEHFCAVNKLKTECAAVIVSNVAPRLKNKVMHLHL
jgi:hypothetical protein